MKTSRAVGSVAAGIQAELSPLLQAKHGIEVPITRQVNAFTVKDASSSWSEITATKPGGILKRTNDTLNVSTWVANTGNILQAEHLSLHYQSTILRSRVVVHTLRFCNLFPALNSRKDTLMAFTDRLIPTTWAGATP